MSYWMPGILYFKISHGKVRKLPAYTNSSCVLSTPHSADVISNARTPSMNPYGWTCNCVSSVSSVSSDEFTCFLYMRCDIRSSRLWFLLVPIVDDCILLGTREGRSYQPMTHCKLHVHVVIVRASEDVRSKEDAYGGRQRSLYSRCKTHTRSASSLTVLQMSLSLSTRQR